MALLAAVALAVAALEVGATPDMGAIRWDAWYWDGTSYDPNWDIVGRTVTVDMQPPQFHFRVPFYGKAAANGTYLPGLGNSSAVMGQEIDMAAQAGIKFFAYCTYPVWCADYHPTPQQCGPAIQGCCADNAALSYALLQHLDIPDPKVNISLILQAQWFANPQSYGNAETMEQQVARYASYFVRQSYHKVAGGRPLVFMLGGTPDVLNPGLQALRDAATKAGSQKPYIVLMGGSDTVSTWKNAQAMGMDGVSYYVIVQEFQANGSSYAANMEFSKQSWQAGAQVGAPVIPTMTAGWDPRPRELIPLPWGNVTCRYGPGNCFMEDPTMDQLTQATKDAVDFASTNEPYVALISAWNEYDEGHWISPSLLQGSIKLDAVAKALLP